MWLRHRSGSQERRLTRGGEHPPGSSFFDQPVSGRRKDRSQSAPSFDVSALASNHESDWAVRDDDRSRADRVNNPARCGFEQFSLSGHMK